VDVLDVVTANGFQKSPGEYLDPALRRPLTLTKHGRPHLVLIAADEYRRLIKPSEQTPTRAPTPPRRADPTLLFKTEASSCLTLTTAGPNQ
jgi:prevent-host-death family protein